MSVFARIDLYPSPRKRARFALELALGGALLAGVVYVRTDAGGAALTIVSTATALALAALVPRLGRIVYVAWMGLGACLGALTGPVVLAIFFFGIVTPIALLRRYARRLSPRAKARPSTYFQKVPPKTPRSDYFRPF